MQQLANTTYLQLSVTDADTNGLQILAFDGIEGLDSEYIFEITLINENVKYDITQLLNKSAYLSFSPYNNSGIHGQIQLVKQGKVGKGYTLFKVILAPRFYHLYNETNQKNLVGKTVIEMITTLLTDKGYQQGQDFEFKLKDQSIYLLRKFCCQYDENIAHYIHRLCEEEGIHCHYEFTYNNHKLILSDANPFFPTLPNAFQYMADTGFSADYPVFKQFDVHLNSITMSDNYRNYNIKNIEISKDNDKNTLHFRANKAMKPRLDYYSLSQYHNNEQQAKRYAKLQVERLKIYQIQAEANSDIATLHCGNSFSLEGHPPIDNLNTSSNWLITQLYHQVRQPQALEKFGEKDRAIIQEPSLLFKYYLAPINKALHLSFNEFKQGYRNSLIAIPKDIPYRPQRLHPRQRILDS